MFRLESPAWLTFSESVILLHRLPRKIINNDHHRCHQRLPGQRTQVQRTTEEMFGICFVCRPKQVRLVRVNTQLQKCFNTAVRAILKLWWYYLGRRVAEGFVHWWPLENENCTLIISQRRIFTKKNIFFKPDFVSYQAENAFTKGSGTLGESVVCL